LVVVVRLRIVLLPRSLALRSIGEVRLRAQARLGLELLPPPDEEIPTLAPATSGRHGPKPVLFTARDAADEAEQIAGHIQAARARGLAWNDIAVLCRTRTQMAPIALALQRRGWPVASMGAAEFRGFDWRRSCIRLLTLHSAKGLEFALVLVAGLQAMPWRGESMDDAVRLLYVAMTRATQALVLSACGTSLVVERVHQALSSQPQPRLQLETQG